MNIREYRPADAGETLEVFRRAVLETAAGDYSLKQREAWAASAGSLEAWNRVRMATHTLVAEVEQGDGSAVAGFADVDDRGHLGMLFTHPQFGRRGVASALLTAVIASAEARGIRTITVDASLTARLVFERFGFTVEREQTVTVRGVALTNFRMVRSTPVSSE